MKSVKDDFSSPTLVLCSAAPCDKTVWFECECEWLEAAKWWDSLEVTIQSKSDDLLYPRGHEV